MNTLTEGEPKEEKDWERRYRSLAETTKQLERKLSDARQIIAILEAEKRQWTDAKKLQQKIIAQHLGTSDDSVRKLQDEIIALKAEIKRLKNGDQH